MSNLLTGPSYSLHLKAKKLIVMLHGYGDTAENFVYIASQIDKKEWGAHYISLNAPENIPNYPRGNQWFDIYPNGIYIAEAGPNELTIIRQAVKKVVVKINVTKFEFNGQRIFITCYTIVTHILYKQDKSYIYYIRVCVTCIIWCMYISELKHLKT